MLLFGRHTGSGNLFCLGWDFAWQLTFSFGSPGFATSLVACCTDKALKMLSCCLQVGRQLFLSISMSLTLPSWESKWQTLGVLYLACMACMASMACTRHAVSPSFWKILCLIIFFFFSCCTCSSFSFVKQMTEGDDGWRVWWEGRHRKGGAELWSLFRLKLTSRLKSCATNRLHDCLFLYEPCTVCWLKWSFNYLTIHQLQCGSTSEVGKIGRWPPNDLEAYSKITTNLLAIIFIVLVDLIFASERASDTCQNSDTHFFVGLRWFCFLTQRR